MVLVKKNEKGKEERREGEKERRRRDEEGRKERRMRGKRDEKKEKEETFLTSIYIYYPIDKEAKINFVFKTV